MEQLNEIENLVDQTIQQSNTNRGSESNPPQAEPPRAINIVQQRNQFSASPSSKPAGPPSIMRVEEEKKETIIITVQDEEEKNFEAHVIRPRPSDLLMPYKNHHSSS